MRIVPADRCAHLTDGKQCERKREPTRPYCSRHDYQPPPGMLAIDIIKDIAMDIGKETAAYIEVMYPEAAKASSSTFMLSLRNHVYNEIMAAVELNDVDAIRKRLAERAAFRKKWVEVYRKLRRAKKAKPTRPMERLNSPKF